MDKPNIVFILIDDLGGRDITSYGSTFYETPNIDSIGAAGMTFTDGYAACPVCSPTRASIMTGKYPATVGVTNFIAGVERGRLLDVPYVKHLPLSEKTIAATLRDAGYQTWHVGKWHLGGKPYWPEKHGFDINIAGCDWGMPGKGYFSPYGMPTMSDGPEGEYLTDRLTDEAIKLIEKSDGRPFFLNLWHYTVHTPIQAKTEHIARFEQKAKDLGLDKIDPFETGEHFPCEHKKDKRVIRRRLQSDPVYAAMIYSLDENVGRLLKAIDDAGQTDNTIVVFTSDNGGLATAEGSPTCNAPFAEGKGWMYEGGTREPLLIRWPARIAAGSTCGVPVTSPDFYPTFLEAAGLALMPEQHTDGTSIMPLLQGADSLDRDAIYWHYPHYGNQGGTPGSSIRMGDFKLIEFLEDNHIELYNLRDDVSEEHNMAGDTPGVASEMRQMLADWRERIGAQIPEHNPDWKPA